SGVSRAFTPERPPRKEGSRPDHGGRPGDRERPSATAPLHLIADLPGRGEDPCRHLPPRTPTAPRAMPLRRGRPIHPLPHPPPPAPPSRRARGRGGSSSCSAPRGGGRAARTSPAPCRRGGRASPPCLSAPGAGATTT